MIDLLEYFQPLIFSIISIIIVWKLGKSGVNEYQKQKDTTEIKIKLIDDLIILYNAVRLFGLGHISEMRQNTDLTDYFYSAFTQTSILRAKFYFYYNNILVYKEFTGYLKEFELLLNKYKNTNWENDLYKLYMKTTVWIKKAEIEL